VVNLEGINPFKVSVCRFRFSVCVGRYGTYKAMHQQNHETEPRVQMVSVSG
jgi:hypothetical protein